MMNKLLRIGTRDSQLAVWQATCVMDRISALGFTARLVFIKSEGDVDLHTPLYEMGVQGVFTRRLDSALLAGEIDIAVHSMKDVPTQPAVGIVQAAVLERASHLDLLVYKNGIEFLDESASAAVIATSSVRRQAQWLNRYPSHRIVNLRGNVNTRLKKLAENEWQGAIFAAAGLERIGLRPEKSIELDWMLPAPAQGAIMIVARENDKFSREVCAQLNNKETELCTRIERDFLRALLGGCSTPISALAEFKNGKIRFQGNILTPDGKYKKEITVDAEPGEALDLGKRAAANLLKEGGEFIAERIRHAQ
jgi:hydroxymethylbilane synthase